MSAFLEGPAKKQPVHTYWCAGCGQNIAHEAVPVAVRVSAFIVPEAARDRGLGAVPFDTTDVGLPPLVRELIDQDKHPDGHVYMSVGCFARLFEQRLVTNAGDEVASVVPMRALLDATGVTNGAFTGREHRDRAAARESSRGATH